MQAAQLLGCQSILVGISPEIAQTLVGLGVDFSRIKTLATLQSGLRLNMRSNASTTVVNQRRELAKFRAHSSDTQGLTTCLQPTRFARVQNS